MSPKIYTKTGDKGLTSLVDNSRVSKSHNRIHAIGALDEANAAIGLLLVSIPISHATRSLLMKTQSNLFACGARLAEPTEATQLKLRLPDSELIKEYELAIDIMTKKMPPLTRFILPGGTEAAARAHLARTVIRRAERAVIALRDTEKIVDSEIIRYLNRLSDWLFTLARYYNHEAKVADTQWKS